MRPVDAAGGSTPGRPPVGEPPPVGERVQVALALLPEVLAVLVARAVAPLLSARERAAARDSVVLVQVPAVPARPIVHGRSTSELMIGFTPAKLFHAAAAVKTLIR